MLENWRRYVRSEEQHETMASCLVQLPRILDESCIYHEATYSSHYEKELSRKLLGQGVTHMKQQIFPP